MIIGFVFTNFNNSKLSIQAAHSIASNHKDCIYKIFLVDNASNDFERDILAEKGALPPHCTVIWNSVNVGYFAGLNIGIDAFRACTPRFDAIVVGNNDLVFSRQFFVALNDCSNLLNSYSVISPDIITLENEHQNPHVSISIGRFREVVWDLYFWNFHLSQIISFFAAKFRSILGRKDHLAWSKEGPIYQGYGACYILTSRFFRYYGRLWSPGFVMGEEFYLARQLASNGEQMYYIPSIPVHHHDHATVSKLPSRSLWEMTRHYHRIYRFFVSPYRVRMDNGKTPSDYESSAYKSSN